MVLLLQNPANAWGPAIGNIGSVLGQALQEGFKERAKRQEQSTLNRLLGLGQEIPVMEDNLTPGMQPQAEGMPSQQNAPPITQLDDRALLALSNKYPQLAALAQKQKTANQKAFEANRSYEQKIGEKGRERIDSLRQALPQKRMALDTARIAVESGKVGAFSRANLAQILNRPELQTATGAALITASKENLLTNMSRVSARAQNQWFERRLNEMFPKIGQSKEANLTVQEMLEGELLLNDLLVNEYDKLSAQDRQQYGYERGDLEKRAIQQIEPLEKKVFDRQVYRMKELMEQDEGMRKLSRNVGKAVIKGTPLTLGMANLYVQRYGDLQKALQVAKKNGYRIPTQEEFQFYNAPISAIREELK